MGDSTPARRSQTKPLAKFLQEINRGRFHAELSEAFADVVGGVMQHGKPGTFTLKIKVRPEGKENVAILADYAAVPPTPPLDAALYFADPMGHMSRDRINQDQFPGLEGLDGGESADPKTDAAGEAAQA